MSPALPSAEDALSLGRAIATAIDRLDVGVVVHDAGGRIVEANEPAAGLLGLTMGQLLGRDSFDPRWRAVGQDGRVMPGDQHPAMVALRDGVEIRDSLLGVEVPDRGLRWLSVSAFPIRTETGDGDSPVLGVTAVFRDVTDAAVADEALRVWERRYRLAAELAPVGIAILSADGFVIRANRTFERLLERTEQQMQVRRWYEVLPVADAGSFRPLAHRIVEDEESVASLEVALETDPPRWLRVHAGVLDMPDAPREVVAVVEDATADVQRRRQLERRADRDPLTGLLNMRAMLDRAGHQESARQAALYVDVDGFKQINDTHGHEVGDVVLVALAGRLADQVRGGDLVARAGGDEFVLLLQGMTDEVARDIAGRIVSAAREPVHTPVGDVIATVSVGLALAPADTPLGDLLRRADRSMYAAKAGGRDRLVVAPDG